MNHHNHRQYAAPVSQQAYGSGWNPPTSQPPPSYQPPVYTGYYQQHQPYSRAPTVPAAPTSYPPPHQVQQPLARQTIVTVPTVPPHEPEPNALYETCVYVGLEDAPQDFRLAFKVIGEKGQNLEYLSRTTGAKVILRGRGTGLNNSKPLHIYVGHTSLEGKEEAESLANNLVRAVKEEYTDWRKSKGLDIKLPLSQPLPIVHRPFENKPLPKPELEKRRLTITRGPVGREEGRIEDRRVVQIQRPDSAMNRLGPVVPVPYPDAKNLHREKQNAPHHLQHHHEDPAMHAPIERSDDGRGRRHDSPHRDRRLSRSPVGRYSEFERQRSRSPLPHRPSEHSRSSTRDDRHHEVDVRERNRSLPRAYRLDEPEEERPDEAWSRERRHDEEYRRDEQYGPERFNRRFKEKMDDDRFRDDSHEDRYTEREDDSFRREEHPNFRDARRDPFKRDNHFAGRSRGAFQRFRGRGRRFSNDGRHDSFRDRRDTRDDFEHREERYPDMQPEDRFKEADRYRDHHREEPFEGHHRRFSPEREWHRREHEEASDAEEFGRAYKHAHRHNDKSFGEAFEMSQKFHEKSKDFSKGTFDRGQRYFIPGMRGKPLEKALETRDFSRLVPIFAVKKIQGRKTNSIWVVGDMFAYLACQCAADNPNGPNLGLPNTMVFWFAYPQITMTNAPGFIGEKMERNLPPDTIILHLGADELVKYVGKSKMIEKDMRKMIDNIRMILPKTHISWSNILPWKKYPSKESNSKLVELKDKMNAVAKDLMKEFKGSTLFHDNDFQKDRKDGVEVYMKDGFYPSEEGAKRMVLNFADIIKNLVSEPSLS